MGLAKLSGIFLVFFVILLVTLIYIFGFNVFKMQTSISCTLQTQNPVLGQDLVFSCSESGQGSNIYNIDLRGEGSNVNPSFSIYINSVSLQTVDVSKQGSLSSGESTSVPLSVPSDASSVNIVGKIVGKSKTVHSDKSCTCPSCDKDVQVTVYHTRCKYSFPKTDSASNPSTSLSWSCDPPPSGWELSYYKHRVIVDVDTQPCLGTSCYLEISDSSSSCAGLSHTTSCGSMSYYGYSDWCDDSTGSGTDSFTLNIYSFDTSDCSGTADVDQSLNDYTFEHMCYTYFESSSTNGYPSCPSGTEQVTTWTTTDTQTNHYSTDCSHCGSCTPNFCPSGYRDEGVSCGSSTCVRTCVKDDYPDNPYIRGGNYDLDGGVDTTQIQNIIIDSPGDYTINIYAGSGGNGIDYYIQGSYKTKPFFNVSLQGSTIFSDRIDTGNQINLDFSDKRNTLDITTDGSVSYTISGTYTCHVKPVGDWQYTTENLANGTKITATLQIESDCDLSDIPIKVDLTGLTGIDKTTTTPLVSIDGGNKIEAQHGSWYTYISPSEGTHTITVEYIVPFEPQPQPQPSGGGVSSRSGTTTKQAEIYPTKIVFIISEDKIYTTNLYVKNTGDTTLHVIITKSDPKNIINVFPDSQDILPGEEAKFLIQLTNTTGITTYSAQLYVNGVDEKPVTINVSVQRTKYNLFIEQLATIAVLSVVGIAMWALNIRWHYILLTMIIVGVVMYFISPIIMGEILG